MPAQYWNVCFTFNNPDGHLQFDEESMSYLVYQEEQGESGTHHFQGYCEFKAKLSLGSAKELLGGDTVHIERRRGTQSEAINYCKKRDDSYIDGPWEFGECKAQGKRVDLEAFKDAVMSGKRKRDLVDEHLNILARYPKFYTTLTEMHRPRRSEELVVTLNFGPTGTGKTRTVFDKYEDDPEFYITPLSNGTPWYDGYDGHTIVLLDDFSGSASHISLCNLLRLLDRYPLYVPTKGSHTWWLPTEVFITSNIHPAYWYKDWTNRVEQYDALARRIHKVCVYSLPMPGIDCLPTFVDKDLFFSEERPVGQVYADL